MITFSSYLLQAMADYLERVAIDDQRARSTATDKVHPCAHPDLTEGIQSEFWAVDRAFNEYEFKQSEAWLSE